jgi:hypothetical protein
MLLPATHKEATIMTTRENKPKTPLSLDGATLLGIHAVEITQTAIIHPELWTSLHSALAVGLGLTIIKIALRR